MSCRSWVSSIAVRFAPAARAAAGAVLALGLLAGAPARAQEAPQAAPQPDIKMAKPVRWDQTRVTKLAVDLAAAVHDAREAVRRSPMSHNIGQRTTYYELTETMRLADNSAGYLKKQLEAGKDAEETRPTFERISSLRSEAEELGRRALVESPVIDALTRAGAIHNQMKPYYYGKQ